MTTNLQCPECHTTYESGPEEPWRCSCGHPLEFADRPIPPDPTRAVSPDPADDGLWTFEEFLPIDADCRVTLGEGWTPLVDTPAWDAQFKLEYVCPTGSFKDRGATTMLSRAVELGVDTVIEDSSGNAGAAIATYAARAGIDAEIYVPASVSAGKVRAIECSGARAIRVDGDRSAVTAACQDAVDAGYGWYASHAWNPAFFAGTMTFAFEVVAQRDWQAPDAIITPVGHGTLLLGAYRGFSRLVDAGVIDEIPPIYGAQTVEHSPIVDAFETVDEGGSSLADRTDLTTDDDGSTIAGGIAIDDPAREHQILSAIRESNGNALALESEAIESTLERLHQAGFYVEPTSAVAPAALERLRANGTIDASADVVVPLTGSGLKMS